MKSKVLSNLMWRFMERCSAQLVTFIVSIVLARMITPEAYGKVAILMVFINILIVFVDSGFANALIQKEKVDQIDFSTVFYFNIVLCLGVYALVWVLSPTISAFYHDESLTSPLRILALTIVFSGIKNVQQAYVSRNLIFKKFFFSTLGGTIFAAAIGILMAYNGMGIWALVAQYLSNTIVDTMVLWMTVGWRPIKSFSWQRLASLFNYGSKLLLSSLLNTVYENFRQLIIGRVYSSSDLAYYNKGKSFPGLIVTNINNSIDSVLFPVMSIKQDNYGEVKNMIKKSVCISSYILWPMLLGLCGISYPLVRLLLTNTWIPSVPYLWIFCFIYASYPIQTANLNALKAIGRTDLYLKIEIEQISIGLFLLLIGFKFGSLTIAIMYLISSIINTALICGEIRKIFGYGFLSQFVDTLPNLIQSVVMLGLTLLIYKFNQDFWIIIVQIGFAIIFYITSSVLTRNPSLSYLCSILIKHKHTNREVK